ncbi:MAG: hypothetical protein QXW79_01490 [Thermoplasmata archaeon]
MSDRTKINESQTVSLTIIDTQTTHQERYSSILDIITPLYKYLFDSIKFCSQSEPKFHFPEVKIIIYYYNLPVSIFNVSFDNGVVLYNSDNKIKLSSISPQHAALDILITKIFEECSQGVSNIENLETNTIEFCDRKVNNIRDELKVFESDKRSYVLIKKDVEEGKITEDEINLFFVPKYQIFRILESRGVINFLNNNKLDEEYRHFKVLYDACKDDESNSREQKVVPYIPHNFQYLSEQEKKSYVEKYHMTMEEFKKICDEDHKDCIVKEFEKDKHDNK